MSQDGNWIEPEWWDKLRISEEDLGADAVMGDFHVYKVGVSVPVSEELTTGTTHFQRQPQPWHRRLKWRARHGWWELRTRLALAIGGGEVIRSDDCY